MVILAIGVALVWKPDIGPVLVRSATVGAVALVIVILYVLFPSLGFDYHIFWGAGDAVWKGLDPYAAERFPDLPFVNPPTALPLFAAFAMLPFRTSFAVWTILNVLICLALPALAQHVLVAQERAFRPTTEEARVLHELSAPALMGLTAALIVSDAAFTGFFLGQLSVLVALALVAALGAQARGRPVLAGFWLSLATVKVVTMLPFLLLFLRKGDRRTWISLAACCIVLIAITGHVGALPNRLALMADRVAKLGMPGMVNDYSFQGTRNEAILGFDHALYRLGLRDRRVIRIGQYLGVLVTGTWVARQVRAGGALPRGAACALVALCSTLFLYHRNYDTVILALPLVYCAGRARAETGRRRCLFAACATSIYLVTYLDREWMASVTKASMGWGIWGRLVQATVLPYATWMILLAMVGIVAGEAGVRGRAARAPRT